MHAFFGGIQRQSSELLANFSWQKESRFFGQNLVFQSLGASLWISKHRKECAECTLLSVESNDRVLNCSPIFGKSLFFWSKSGFFEVCERPSLAGWIPATGGADAALWISKHRKECAECMLFSVESNDRVANCSPIFRVKRCLNFLERFFPEDFFM